MTDRPHDAETQMMTQAVVMTCVFLSLWLATGVAAIRFIS